MTPNTYVLEGFMSSIKNIEEIKSVIDSYVVKIIKISNEVREERKKEDFSKRKIAKLNGIKSGLYRRMRREVRSLIVADITDGKKYSIFSVQKLYTSLFNVSMNRDYLHDKFDFELSPGSGRAADVIFVNDDQKREIEAILKLM